MTFQLKFQLAKIFSLNKIHLQTGKSVICFVRQVFIGLLIAFPCTTSLAIAQTDSLAEVSDTEQKSLFSMGVGLQHGFIFAHSQDVQNTSGARPTGMEAIFSWQRNDSAMFSLCHCYPRQGLMPMLLS